MPRNVYTGMSILIVGFIIINYIMVEFLFEEKRLNEISKNKFSLKITRYTVSGKHVFGNLVLVHTAHSNIMLL